MSNTYNVASVFPVASTTRHPGWQDRVNMLWQDRSNLPWERFEPGFLSNPLNNTFVSAATLSAAKAESIGGPSTYSSSITPMSSVFSVLFPNISLGMLAIFSALAGTAATPSAITNVSRSMSFVGSFSTLGPASFSSILPLLAHPQHGSSYSGSIVMAQALMPVYFSPPRAFFMDQLDDIFQNRSGELWQKDQPSGFQTLAQVDFLAGLALSSLFSLLDSSILNASSAINMSAVMNFFAFLPQFIYNVMVALAGHFSFSEASNAIFNNLALNLPVSLSVTKLASAIYSTGMALLVASSFAEIAPSSMGTIINMLASHSFGELASALYGQAVLELSASPQMVQQSISNMSAALVLSSTEFFSSLTTMVFSQVVTLSSVLSVGQGASAIYNNLDLPLNWSESFQTSLGGITLGFVELSSGMSFSGLVNAVFAPAVPLGMTATFEEIVSAIFNAGMLSSVNAEALMTFGSTLTALLALSAANNFETLSQMLGQAQAIIQSNLLQMGESKSANLGTLTQLASGISFRDIGTITTAVALILGAQAGFLDQGQLSKFVGIILASFLGKDPSVSFQGRQPSVVFSKPVTE